MVSLIIGNKGSGKTKRLISMIDEAVERSNGSVVVLEKSPLLTYEITHRARLVETETYGVEGVSAFYGMICGILAQDHDITEIFVDATFKIIGRNYDEFVKLLVRLKYLSETFSTDFVMTVSEDEANLPASVFDYAQKI